MTKTKRTALIKEARELGLKSIEIDGVTYNFDDPKSKTVPTLEAKDIVNPMSALDDLSEDEILYYATPYYDEMQHNKKIREQQLKDEQTK